MSDSANEPSAHEVDHVLDTWVRELARALDIDPSVVPRALVLDVARDAARHVARPAAPLTTFVVGYAAGRAAATRSGEGTSSRHANDEVYQAAGVAQALAMNRPAV